MRALLSAPRSGGDRRASRSFYEKSARTPEAVLADILRAQTAQAAAQQPTAQFAHA